MQQSPIKRWTAVRLAGHVPQGRTRPLILTCRPEDDLDDYTSETDFLTKIAGSSDIDEKGLFREIFGNCLASLLGINTAPPAIIILTSSFKSSLLGQIDIAKIQGELAAGSAYVKSLYAFAPLSESQVVRNLRQMTDIYAFDMLSQNPDRQSGNPNLAYQGDDLLCYDFETCFMLGALSAIPSLKYSDNPCDIDPRLYESHVFHRYLKGKAVDFKPFLHNVKSVSDGIMHDWESAAPGTWRGESSLMIKYVKHIRDNADEFEQNLCSSLFVSEHGRSSQIGNQRNQTSLF
jgi:hypothetical protein